MTGNQECVTFSFPTSLPLDQDDPDRSRGGHEDSQVPGLLEANHHARVQDVGP